MLGTWIAPTEVTGLLESLELSIWELKLFQPVLCPARLGSGSFFSFPGLLRSAISLPAQPFCSLACRGWSWVAAVGDSGSSVIVATRLRLPCRTSTTIHLLTRTSIIPSRWGSEGQGRREPSSVPRRGQNKLCEATGVLGRECHRLCCVLGVRSQPRRVGKVQRCGVMLASGGGNNFIYNATIYFLYLWSCFVCLCKMTD